MIAGGVELGVPSDELQVVHRFCLDSQLGARSSLFLGVEVDKHEPEKQHTAFQARRPGVQHFEAQAHFRRSRVNIGVFGANCRQWWCQTKLRNAGECQHQCDQNVRGGKEMPVSGRES